MCLVFFIYRMCVRFIGVVICIRGFFFFFRVVFDSGVFGTIICLFVDGFGGGFFMGLIGTKSFLVFVRKDLCKYMFLFFLGKWSGIFG